VTPSTVLNQCIETIYEGIQRNRDTDYNTKDDFSTLNYHRFFALNFWTLNESAELVICFFFCRPQGQSSSSKQCRLLILWWTFGRWWTVVFTPPPASATIQLKYKKNDDKKCQPTRIFEFFDWIVIYVWFMTYIIDCHNVV
jgi:hypothetical protein